MRIQHNIAALNSYRQLSSNNNAVSKNLEKLSSGYRINRAGDDAAGLAISEKMRAQITGLETAQKNANDGISLVQTAEGALTEVHSMLNRMVGLANQSANGTYQDSVDRENLQKEIESLGAEIDRISESTNFNGINLLDGSMEQTKAVDKKLTITGFPAKGDAVDTNTVVHEEGKAGKSPEFSVDLSDIAFNGKDFTTGGTIDVTIGGKKFTVGKGGSSTTKFDSAVTGADIAESLAKIINETASAVDGTTDATKKYGGLELDGMVYTAKADGDKLTFTLATEDKDGNDLGAQDLSGKTDAALTPDYKVTVAATNNADKDGLTGSLNTGTLVITPGEAKTNSVLANTKFNLTKDQLVDGAKLTIGNETYVFKVGADSETAAGNGEKLVDLSAYEDTDAAGFLDAAISALTVAAKDNDMFTVGSSGSGVVTLQEVTGGYTGTGADLTTLDGIKAQVTLTNPGTVAADASKGLTLQIGDTAQNFNKLTVSVKSMSTASLGIGGISIATQDGASAAVDKIKDAINTVSSTRGDLGALQNRLEHTINNLSVTTENMTAAESRIRDVDMAEEMMTYTKNNILVQASTAMLAQANQVPQGVLQLLQ